jgi:hypothetical protein
MQFTCTLWTEVPGWQNTARRTSKPYQGENTSLPSSAEALSKASGLKNKRPLEDDDVGEEGMVERISTKKAEGTGSKDCKCSREEQEQEELWDGWRSMVRDRGSSFGHDQGYVGRIHDGDGTVSSDGEKD